METVQDGHQDGDKDPRKIRMVGRRDVSPIQNAFQGKLHVHHRV